jgi:crossover junction endodeoxyribonuclease RuvC
VFDPRDDDASLAGAADVSAPILGIDPGLSRCGYGAIMRTGATARAVAAGVIRTDAQLALPLRLARLHDEIEALLDDLVPRAVVVERVLFQVNARTAIAVGQASGIALAAAARRQIPVVQYSPNEVKLAISGDGAADKRAVQLMVTKLLRLPVAPEPPDAADALALALCHAWRDRVERAIAGTAGVVAGDQDPGTRVASRLQARIDAALARGRA